jgi:hypothetical protein
MDDATRETMNAKLDVLFDQISALEGARLNKAAYAVELWRSAKVQEHFGLGPMETRSIYRSAYEALRELGLETGGMLKPYERA